MKTTRNMGLTVLGVWLILSGLLPFLNLGIPAIGTLLALLAVVAGVLLIAGR